MSMWDDHYDALYSEFGTPATLTLDSLSDPVTVTAIPKIAGATVNMSDDFSVQTIRPAADVRMAELTEKGVTLTDLRRQHIEVAGATWRIETWEKRPSPEGEANGEVRLVISRT